MTSSSVFIRQRIDRLRDEIRWRTRQFRPHSTALQTAERIASPKLSFCISTYNRAEWLRKCLQNWARLYPDPLDGVEIVVCDNASTDHTEKVAARYLDRADFVYLRNPKNVGMLGNLRVTAHAANGEYVWITGDDDLIVDGALERVMAAIEANPGIALVYLNYAYSRLDDARKIRNFSSYIEEATPVVGSEPDRFGPIKAICARNENFFTAIYTLVFRKDHAVAAYSQDTSGAPFSTMLTCIPTTYYVLNHLMDEPGVWIGEPQIVVNLNVSWMRYAPLWILERIPEVYDAAEMRGVSPDDMNRWRRSTLPAFCFYFKEIFKEEQKANAQFFSAKRAVARFAELPEFQPHRLELMDVYRQAASAGHFAAQDPIEDIFAQSPV